MRRFLSFAGAGQVRVPSLVPSAFLAFLLTASAGMPGIHPLTEQAPPLRLMAMTEIGSSHGGHFVTKASINGKDIMVLVDTGATAVALSYEDAEAAGLKPRGLDYGVKVMTANGEGKAARVKLRYVMIDNVKVRDVDGLVLQEGAMKGTLLGMSFLSKLRSFTVEDGKLLLKN
ncbi:MAG: TIGR02281 family clan AA aspartic protease [Rhizobiales bacterium]|nr:TIGR02281 family clan AA aspartic protease [Hyphomicrobiales bacterium]